MRRTTFRRSDWYDTPFGRLAAGSEQPAHRRGPLSETMRRILGAKVD